MRSVPGADGDRPISVGFVIDGMSGPGSGVWTRFDALVRGLTQASVAVHVVASPNQEYLLATLPADTVTILPRSSPARRLISRSSVLDRFIRAFALDIVHIETPPFPKVTTTPLVGSVHDLRFVRSRLARNATPESLYQRLGLRRQVQNMSAVAVLSPWMGREVARLLDVPSAKIHIIPPIIDAMRVDAAQSTRSRRAPFALVLGHLESRKNAETVVRATFSRNWPSGLALVIAGRDAGDQERLRKLAKGCRVPIEFAGVVDDDAKWQLLADAEVVLVPSLFEGFGIVAVEAPQAGTPALVSDRTALPDLAGVDVACVSALDPEDWAARVALIVGDAAVRDSILAAQVASAQRFATPAVIAQVLQMYRSLAPRAIA